MDQAEHLTRVFGRAGLAEITQGDVSRLSDRLLPHHGITALLRSHLRLIAIEAERLTPAERAVALAAAADMALLALQEICEHAPDADACPAGIYAAACAVIRQECCKPELDPQMVADAVGCSRAKLYRLFAAREASVARMIWDERLDQAFGMLADPEHAGAYIADIAFRCGFIDIPTFNRMFKKRFASTPGAARVASV